ncbi:MAG: nucleotidyltransferase domain-containing protein [Candidatus Kapabacteria bacterium]|nr:nucleotidyltransferase domain-containing protein [Candidatus Kapabacteria bacterium]
MIADQEIYDIVHKITTGYAPDKVILFGSYANGNPNENSDIDLLIIKDTDKSRPERTTLVRKLLFGSMIPIDLIVYTPDELEESKKDKYSFVHQLLNNSITLYERIN